MHVMKLGDDRLWTRRPVRKAKREFNDAISWYQDRREGLGREFSVAVEEQLGRIALSPNQFACVRGDVFGESVLLGSNFPSVRWISKRFDHSGTMNTRATIVPFTLQNFPTRPTIALLRST
jgi:hypothetical protein